MKNSFNQHQRHKVFHGDCCLVTSVGESQISRVELSDWHSPTVREVKSWDWGTSHRKLAAIKARQVLLVTLWLFAVSCWLFSFCFSFGDTETKSTFTLPFFSPLSLATNPKQTTVCSATTCHLHSGKIARAALSRTLSSKMPTNLPRTCVGLTETSRFYSKWQTRLNV